MQGSSYSWECHMKGELPVSAQHGAMPLPPPLGPSTAPAPVPAQSEQGSSTVAGQTAGEGRGRQDHTALISMQRWGDFCRAGLDLVPIHGLQTLSDAASSILQPGWSSSLGQGMLQASLAHAFTYPVLLLRHNTDHGLFLCPSHSSVCDTRPCSSCPSFLVWPVTTFSIQSKSV